MKRITIALSAAISLFACARHDSPPPRGTSVALAPASAPSASAAPPRVTTYKGAYESRPREHFDDGGWSAVHWRGEDASAGVGPGSIALAFDRTTNRVSGELDGPLGPAIVSGGFEGGRATGTVNPTGASDAGLSGVFSATLSSPDVLEGDIRLSSGRANLVRVATFTARASK